MLADAMFGNTTLAALSLQCTSSPPALLIAARADCAAANNIGRVGIVALAQWLTMGGGTLQSLDVSGRC